MTTVIQLPEVPFAGERAVHWWTLGNDGIVAAGTGEEWLDHPDIGPGGSLIALAPASAVRCEIGPAKASADRQALGIARSTALAGALAEPSTLHAASAFLPPAGGGTGERETVTAVVANSSMLEWLDWLDANNADPQAIVPTALLLPFSGNWRSATIGTERLLARDGLVVPDEPALRSALVGNAGIELVSAAVVEPRLAALAAAPPLNLRSGRFARRRLLVLDRARLRELAMLAALVPLLGLLMAIITIARLNGDTRRLDAETATLVSDSVGREVAADAAEAALNSRLSERPGATGSPFQAISAIYQQMQLTPAVGADALAWRADGTLAATLAAPRVDDLNRVLIGLQAAGYRITAVPRRATDGRAITDITLRTAP